MPRHPVESTLVSWDEQANYKKGKLTARHLCESNSMAESEISNLVVAGSSPVFRSYEYITQGCNMGYFNLVANEVWEIFDGEHYFLCINNVS